VQAVCDFFGPTDFLQMDAHRLPNARLVHDSPDSPASCKWTRTGSPMRGLFMTRPIRRSRC
jgi:hypothetical protein